MMDSMGMNSKIQQEIANGLRAGDHSARLQLYETYANHIRRRVALLMGGDTLEVADIVQETFLAANRMSNQFDSRRGSLWMWLWGIARRQMMNHQRIQDTISTRVEKVKRLEDKMAYAVSVPEIATSD